MRTGTSYFKTFSKMMWLFALLLVVFSAGCDRQSAVEGVIVLVDAGPAGAVNLGTASTFGIMATAAITGGNAKTHIYGDVSLDPGTSITSLLAAQVSGTIHVNDAVSAQARADLLAAYNDLSTRPAPATVLTTPATAVGINGGTFSPGVVNLSGFVLSPGIYSVGTIGSNTWALDNSAGPLVLDGGGNAGAVYIFHAYAMTTTSGDVVLRNGARATNVYWVVTTDATIGGGSFFQGTVVAGGNITAVLDANVQGRMLAGANIAGAIVLDGNTVVVPAP